MRKTILYVILYIISFGIMLSTFILHPVARTPFPLVRLIIVFFATILLSKYFVYMTLAPMYDWWAKRRDIKFKDRIATYRPKVSVIIPAWNEAVGIVRTVTSVLENEYAPLEVIVVNDGSTDDSDALMRDFVAKFEADNTINGNPRPGKTIIYHYKENAGKGAALNAGLALASGEIIVSVDADCYVAPTTIGNFVKVFADPEVSAAVGNVKIGNTKTVLGTVQYLEFLFSFYFKKGDSLLNTIYIIGGAAGAFRRDVFDKVGLYHTNHITEDIDLSVRIQEAGLRIVYAADAIVYTEGATDLAALAKQRMRWKRGRFKTFWEHRALFLETEKGLSYTLTLGILPLALFGDLQLFAEMFFIVFLYIYSFWTDNFSSFISGIIVVSAMFVVKIFDDRTLLKNAGFFLLAPIGWLLFYLSTYVEHSALLKSIWGSVKGEDIHWQKWKREGVIDETTPAEQLI